MKKKNFLFLAFLFLAFSAIAQTNSIHWMTIEEAQKADLQQPKKIFVDVYLLHFFYLVVLQYVLHQQLIVKVYAVVYQLVFWVQQHVLVIQNV